MEEPAVGRKDACAVDTAAAAADESPLPGTLPARGNQARHSETKDVLMDNS
ncbi:Hypothetical protein SMAX5B_015780 [Scophthalmus maximus]|uniref:Uncharacterized protein n=1 Tax=Scophthalmus maximus TaxID=52904 RepID=A0A2U9CXT4_SCOMX|nr:Hypothetical protein SMAX5B_015780 [Scophthalmus maximus]